jgi:cell wall assembly regulator SMI1
MKAIWNRIEDWLKIYALEVYNDLLPGASDEEIISTEDVIGIKLPDDVKNSYRIHNGQLGIASPLMGEWQLLSMKNIRSEWQMMHNLFDAGKLTGQVKVKGAVRSEWWNPKWLPLAYNGAGDFYCLDFCPTLEGEVGQVISYWHVSDVREVIANSFLNWLQEFANDLERGKYKVENGEILIVN